MNSASSKDKYLIKAMKEKLGQLEAELPEAEQKAKDAALASQMASQHLKEVKAMIESLTGFLGAQDPGK